MEVFQGNYKIYQSVMCLSGLWPYDNSILTRIHRVAFTLVLLGCMVTQVMTIKNVKMSLNETIGMISFGGQLLLYFIRYSTTIWTFPTTKYVLDNMQNDFNMLKDPIEAEMLLKDSILAKRILMIYIGKDIRGKMLYGISPGGVGVIDVDTTSEYDTLSALHQKEIKAHFQEMQHTFDHLGYH
ncbi:uncharacterized protein LOC143362290 [Halictus rubicundus]|uniref:uncharacterized protein LOC143362290 n=1 Tax=Halictus rubicundus TaxID=77578 RepID=UPI004035D32C